MATLVLAEFKATSGTQGWQSNLSTRPKSDKLEVPKTSEESDTGQIGYGNKGGWLLASPEFERWHNSSSCATLWLRGVPGSGKTTLMSTVIDTLITQNNKNKNTAFFFFQQENQPENPAENILKSLLGQLFTSDIPLKSNFQKKRLHSLINQRCPPSSSSDLYQLFRFVLNIVVGEAEIIFIVDALDENPWIIEAMISASVTRAQDFPKSRPFKHLVSYRSSCQALDQYIEHTLASGNGCAIDLDNSRAAKTDLNRYIEFEKNKLIDENPEGELEIRQVAEFVQQQSAGSFLWARLVLENMAQRFQSGFELKNLDLSLIPLDLDKIYQERLDFALSRDGFSVTEKILKWILYAARPLTAPELVSAFPEASSYLSSIHFDSSSYNAKLLSLEGRWSSICGGLVQISENRCLILAHRTVRDYLYRSNKIGSQACLDLRYVQSHEFLAMTCLEKMIEFAKARNGNAHPKIGFEYRIAFLDYAESHWAKHYRIAEAQSLYLVETVYDYLISLSGGDRDLGNLQHRSDFHHSALRICARAGLTQLCKVLLQMGTSVDINYTFSGTTPLHLASASGHYDTARLLLEYGADTGAMTTLGETPLDIATQYGNREVIELLLRHMQQVSTIEDERQKRVHCIRHMLTTLSSNRCCDNQTAAYRSPTSRVPTEITEIGGIFYRRKG
ncbi:MAG: hypothetical protein LQ342_008389 [Letrouitia transgressa]|nr:MAG: hypothetical protein LQ342_008389 [Letrouitia transgressa]